MREKRPKRVVEVENTLMLNASVTSWARWWTPMKKKKREKTRGGAGIAHAVSVRPLKQAPHGAWLWGRPRTGCETWAGAWSSQRPPGSLFPTVGHAWCHVRSGTPSFYFFLSSCCLALARVRGRSLTYLPRVVPAKGMDLAVGAEHEAVSRAADDLPYIEPGKTM